MIINIEYRSFLVYCERALDVEQNVSDFRWLPSHIPTCIVQKAVVGDVALKKRYTTVAVVEHVRHC